MSLVVTCSGLVTVAGMLDFEVQAAYNLTVIATSTLSSSLFDTALLRVEIIDINERPLFTNSCVPTCELFVAENSSNSLILGTFVVSDPDFPNLPNGQITVTIQNIQPQANFSLVQNRDTFNLITEETLDRETTSSYQLLLRVTDNGNPPLSSTMMLNIVVTDINDNIPQFVQQPSSLTVSELAPNGTVITRYEAIDRDSGINAQIIYSISSVISNVVLPFEIDPVTGDLRVISPLDFETDRSYIVSVKASNPDGVQNTTVTSIIIIDENDNRPLFIQPSYNASVVEDSSVGTFVVRVEASDADFGPRGSFNFSILQNGNFNDTFEISQKGDITLANRVDREQIERFNLTVVATDGGTPSLTSFATVFITIDDVS